MEDTDKGIRKKFRHFATKRKSMWTYFALESKDKIHRMGKNICHNYSYILKIHFGQKEMYFRSKDIDQLKKLKDSNRYSRLVYYTKAKISGKRGGGLELRGVLRSCCLMVGKALSIGSDSVLEISILRRWEIIFISH